MSDRTDTPDGVQGKAIDAARTQDLAPAGAPEDRVLAALRRLGGGGDLRATVPFDGFQSDDQPDSMPFDSRSAPLIPRGPQPDVGLPFRRESPAAPVASPVPPPAAAGVGHVAPLVAAPLPVRPLPPSGGSPVAPVGPPPSPWMSRPVDVPLVRPPDPLREGHPPVVVEPGDDEPEPAEDVPPRAHRPAAGICQLIWYDEDEVPRVRREETWRALLDELDDVHDEDLDDPAYADEPGEVDDRRDVFEVLARGAPTEIASLEGVLKAAVREGSKLAPPLVLLDGELRMPFDELARLEATAAAARPFARGQEQLAATLADIDAFVAAVSPPVGPGVPTALTRRLVKDFEAVGKLVSQGYLEQETERALLIGRRYQRRAVLGGEHLRGLLAPERSTPDDRCVPTYLPAALERRLPMFACLRVRLLAELAPREDQHERHATALRVVALARVTPPDSKATKRTD